MDLQCKICSIKFEQESLLLSHIGVHLGRKCPTCFQPFTSQIVNENALNAKCKDSHVWLSSQAQKFSTDPLNTAPPLETISTVKPKYAYQRREIFWECQHCDYKTNIRGSLSKHMRTHTNERPYLCEECGKRFTVHCNLKQHIQSVHTKVKPYKCSHCGLGFIRRDRLRAHERTHTGEKPFECTHCKQKFSRKQSLNKHLKMHTGWECRYCSKIFESESKLKSHKLLMHKDVNAETGTKWFEFGCNLCQKRFQNEELLKEHVKLHPNAWLCDKCHYVFEEEGALRAHQCNTSKSPTMVIKTAEPLKCLQERIKKEKERELMVKSKQFYCKECDRYFKSGKSLGGHRSRMHSIKEKKKKKTVKRKKRKKTKQIKPKKEEINEDGDYVKNEKFVDNEEQNELDILVGRCIQSKGKTGVDILGEYANNIKQTNEPKIERIKSIKDCPAKHGLIKQLTPNNRVFECNECNKTMYLNEEMHGCRWCDFHLCVECYQGTNNEMKDTLTSPSKRRKITIRIPRPKRTNGLMC